MPVHEVMQVFKGADFHFFSSERGFIFSLCTCLIAGVIKLNERV